MTASLTIQGRAKAELGVASPITSWWGGAWSAATIQAWVKTVAGLSGTDLNRGIFIQGTPGNQGTECGIALYWRETAADTAVTKPILANFTCGTTSAQKAYAVSVKDQQLIGVNQLLHSTWASGGVPAIYSQGALVANSASTAPGTGTIFRAAGTVYLGETTTDGAGNHPRAGTWKGLIDEVRLRAQALPAEHIALEYDNWTVPQGVYAIGAEDQALDSDHGPVAGPNLDFPGTQNVTLQGATALDPLANDYDPDGDAKTLVSVTAVSNCTVSKDATDANKVKFVPDGGFIGRAIFTYVLAAGTKQTTGWASVDVVAGTPVPVGAEVRTTPFTTITSDALLDAFIAPPAPAVPDPTKVATMS